MFSSTSFSYTSHRFQVLGSQEGLFSFSALYSLFPFLLAIRKGNPTQSSHPLFYLIDLLKERLIWRLLAISTFLLVIPTFYKQSAELHPSLRCISYYIKHCPGNLCNYFQYFWLICGILKKLKTFNWSSKYFHSHTVDPKCQAIMPFHAIQKKTAALGLPLHTPNSCWLSLIYTFHYP